eukprot:TRINITY_DN2361_c0_g1_i1.p1 TRINITY_DN2361_c0_g1~~TRINITY_DN2361_c0_g1_i1.p1  ORF type:complete len:432 (+),score=89.44 TRINITY_DN2361_c0_g1_i1:62-1297(+)
MDLDQQLLAQVREPPELEEPPRTRRRLEEDSVLMQLSEQLGEQVCEEQDLSAQLSEQLGEQACEAAQLSKQLGEEDELSAQLSQQLQEATAQRCADSGAASDDSDSMLMHSAADHVDALQWKAPGTAFLASVARKRLRLRHEAARARIRSTRRFGNYEAYYGYRSVESDHRPAYFAKLDQSLLAGKDWLDVGCNNGLLTYSLAARFQARSVVGVDVDDALVYKANSRAVKRLELLVRKERKDALDADEKRLIELVDNMRFVCFDMVADDSRVPGDAFDVVTCLSVTKWVHLNAGDSGVKKLFLRIYDVLRPGGIFILEPQPWYSYRKRKVRSDPAFRKQLRAMEFKPAQFERWLVEVCGFEQPHVLLRGRDLPRRAQGGRPGGFNRDILVFRKPDTATASDTASATEAPQD